MESANQIRNRIIDNILGIQNTEFLKALDAIIQTSKIDNEAIILSSSQKELLQLSEQDIQYGRVVSQDELDDEDMEWLRKK